MIAVLMPFATLFSKNVWQHGLTLFIGAVLCRGKRTVTAALRIMGLRDEKKFHKYHRVLSQSNWSALQGAKILLGLLIPLLPSESALIIAVDETLERRKGKKINAKGCYRDAVRSSQKTVVKCFGLKWLSMMLIVRLPWSSRSWALPFLTILEPSKKSDEKAKRQHKTTIDWTIQALKQTQRWVKNKKIILVGDGGFAVAALAWACLKLKVTLVSRLRMDARLFDFAPERPPGQRGRWASKGNRLMTFKEMLQATNLSWREGDVLWYGGVKKRIKFLTSTALWHVAGSDPVPIRWVLVLDPEGKTQTIPLFSTDVTLSAEEIVQLFIERWNEEVTFEEVRAHLGVETQRQWSNEAIARTTPVLMATYSLVCLMANEAREGTSIPVEQTAWYQKKEATFSDVLTYVREEIWRKKYLNRFVFSGRSDEIQCPPELAELLAQLAAAA